MEGTRIMKKVDIIIIIYLILYTVSVVIVYSDTNLTIATCASYSIIIWILVLLKLNNKSFRNWLNKPFNKK